MATKIFSHSSILVFCRRSILNSQPSKGTKVFSWFGNSHQTKKFSIGTIKMASANNGGDAVKILDADVLTKVEPSEDIVSNASPATTVSSSLETAEGESKQIVETTESTSDTVSPPNANATVHTEERKPRVPKVKAAILLSYSGLGYFGMQMQNNGTRTIENDLIKAFYEAGVIDKDGFDKPKSMKFQRAARTDKNVSAARNIVSILVPKTFDVDSVNKFLPDQIRVMDYRRVTKGFDSKNTCCARTYLYMIPTFAFVPLEEKVVESFRVTPEIMEKLRSTLKLYVGTKNYHNFTSRKKPTDPSAFRFIMSFISSEPFVKEGLEYVVLQVKGQSFMLHQIRKMIGLAVAIMRGCATEETINKAFTLNRIDIPMAPGLGLMLGETHYDHYNKKFGRDGIHEPLVWDNVADKIEQFCQEKIYTVVTQTENEEKSMFNWLATVPFHTYDVREDVEGKEGGLGPIGKAQQLVRKESGEEVSEDEELDDDDDVPTKKQKLNV